MKTMNDYMEVNHSLYNPRKDDHEYCPKVPIFPSHDAPCY